MEKNLLIGHIDSLVQKADTILLSTHESPDIDAISSVFAFSHYLDMLQKKHEIFLKDVPKNEFEEIVSYKNFSSDPLETLLKKYDLIIIFDSGDLLHTGIEEMLLIHHKNTTICNIDHHPTNVFFGKLNLIITEAVSTTEIIFDYMRHMDVRISREQSSYLLAGILGDTNHFTNHNTTPRSIEIASDLIKTGVNINKIFTAIKHKKTVNTINSWGKILSRLKINAKYNIAVTVITKKDIEEIGDNPEVFSGLSNYLNNISGVKISMVIKEAGDGMLKISMRSNDDLLDLSKLVKIFNGGGHKKAAGFSIKGKIIETQKGWRII